MKGALALVCLATSLGMVALTFGLVHVEGLRSRDEQHLHHLQTRIDVLERKLEPPSTVTCYRWGGNEAYREVPCDFILPEHPRDR